MTAGCPNCGHSADKPKGGKLARTAAMLCQNAEFRLYLDWRARAKYKLSVPDGTHTEEDARRFILQVCGIGSRAELDSSLVAAQWFNKIQRGFAAYRRRKAQQGGYREAG